MKEEILKCLVIPEKYYPALNQFYHFKSSYYEKDLFYFFRSPCAWGMQ